MANAVVVATAEVVKKLLTRELVTLPKPSWEDIFNRSFNFWHARYQEQIN